MSDLSTANLRKVLPTLNRKFTDGGYGSFSIGLSHESPGTSYERKWSFHVCRLDTRGSRAVYIESWVKCEPGGYGCMYGLKPVKSLSDLLTRLAAFGVKVAAGCARCYAETLAKRNPGTLGVWGAKGTRVVASESQWRQPEKWNTKAMVWPLHLELCRRAGIENPILAWEQQDDGNLPDPELMRRPRVFCASLADVFEDWQGVMRDSCDRELYVHDCESHPEPFRYVPMPHAGRDALLEHERENLDSGMYRRLTVSDVRRRLFALIDKTQYLDWLLLTKRPRNILRMWPSLVNLLNNRRPNVWLGASLACRDDLPNVDALRTARELAPVLFLSIEPLVEDLGTLDLTDIDWVIVGGESGPGARPMHPDWVRSIRDQCIAAGVPFFFKQWGEWGTKCTDMLTKKPVFKQFTSHQQWINKASSWVNGGICLDCDGRELKRGSDFARAWNESKFPVTIMQRIGKKAAGRLLEGRTWDQFPEVTT